MEMDDLLRDTSILEGQFRLQQGKTRLSSSKVAYVLMQNDSFRMTLKCVDEKPPVDTSIYYAANSMP
jgi:hypothetical protein